MSKKTVKKILPEPEKNGKVDWWSDGGEDEQD